MRFRHRALPMRVIFGAGRVAELDAELDELGLRRVLVLSTPGRQELARDVAESLGEHSVGVHPHASEHVPVQAAAAAAKAAMDADADGCAAPASAPRPWGCTTSWPTSSAAASGCRTPARTRSRWRGHCR